LRNKNIYTKAIVTYIDGSSKTIDIRPYNEDRKGEVLAKVTEYLENTEKYSYSIDDVVQKIEVVK